MKKTDFKALALLGLAGGLLVSNSTTADESHPQFNSTDSSRLAVHNSCKGPSGCDGLSMKSGCRGTSGCGGLLAKCGSKCGGVIADTDKTPSKDSSDDYSNPDEGNMGYHLMTEQELLMELNDNGIKLYKSLDPEGKALARLVASQRCNATNACKGLNACQTEKNACAGKGDCKAKGKCAFSDKNLAVKVVAKKMAEKRSQGM